MSYLEERLRQMEEALSRSYTQPTVPISTQGAFREEHAQTPPPNQLSPAHITASATKEIGYRMNLPRWTPVRRPTVRRRWSYSLTIRL